MDIEALSVAAGKERLLCQVNKRAGVQDNVTINNQMEVFCPRTDFYQLQVLNIAEELLSEHLIALHNFQSRASIKGAVFLSQLQKKN